MTIGDSVLQTDVKQHTILTTEQYIHIYIYDVPQLVSTIYELSEKVHMRMKQSGFFQGKTENYICDPLWENIH
jgi:hypothetical protein